jgi:CheY-like chemotaxis protein
MISVHEDARHAMKLGAFAYLKKPVSKAALQDVFARIREVSERQAKRILLVEDNDLERGQIAHMVGGADRQIVGVRTAAEALAVLEDQTFDCLVVDLMLPDMGGAELVEKVKGQPRLEDVPIIVYTGKELIGEEEAQLKALTDTVILKDPRSLDRLLRETAALLDRDAAEAAGNGNGEQPGIDLAGKKVLIVDDDPRNLFALTSMLERWSMTTYRAENGGQALDRLRTIPDIDVVLMDIMMPDMDGYETIRAIRRLEGYQALPIIALTAKAMKRDRQKCLEAGASDYIAKPVNAEQLAALLRVWLSRPQVEAPV